MTINWKSNQAGPASSSAVPELRPVQALPSVESTARIHSVAEVPGQTSISKGMFFKGMITGAGALFVDGEVVGNINLPESRVTVGEHGQVSDGLSVCINAREIVVIGKIRGNISASDRVEIRAHGELIGNVTAGRISIADGAFFKGDIDLKNVQRKSASSDAPALPKQAYA